MSKRVSWVVALCVPALVAAEAPGRVVECNYDLVNIRRESAIFDFDLANPIAWSGYRVPKEVRAAVERATAQNCTVYVFFRSSDGTPSRYDRESVLIACAALSDSTSFWRVAKAQVTTRTGNQKNRIVYQGPAWLWPKPDFSDL
jgi:hypothetical protein